MEIVANGRFRHVACVGSAFGWQGFSSSDIRLLKSLEDMFENSGAFLLIQLRRIRSR
jgi:hypothetical protein